MAESPQHHALDHIQSAVPMSRRLALLRAGGGFGSIALASMINDDSGLAAATTADPLSPTPPHFTAKAKRVIYLFMHGGPSHVDLFDPKPDLIRYAGKKLPDSFGEVMTRRKVANNPLMPPVKPFRKRGQSGTEVSDFLPHIAKCVDDICVLRGCHGDSVNHPQSVYQMNTGSILMGKPSLGSWVSYGLGSDNRNMPGFVVLPDPGGGLKGGPPAWGSGFLPATYQGTTMRPGNSPILNLQPQNGINDAQQLRSLDLIRQLNEHHRQQRDADTRLDARISAYELAYRMQSTAPQMVDIGRESAATHKLYGIDEGVTREFGTRCLLARRMVEQGVRFVQVYSGNTNGWDAHNDVASNHGDHCRRTDKPVAGLLRDLKQRGLLKDTLVIWGGEFGRMPMSEKGTGRDHNPWGYTVWMAGGGIKPGMVWGATDAIGLRAVENKVHIHDLHATILHLLGLDHESLTYLHNGRDQRLTDVAGHVVHEIIA